MKAVTYRRAAQYLGAKKAEEQQQLLPMLRQAEGVLLEKAHPHCLLKRFSVQVCEPSFRLGMLPPVESPQLCALFKEAQEGLAIAVTLGGDVEPLTRRLLLTDPAMGAAVGALASAYVEEVLEQRLLVENRQLLLGGLQLSPRFSPGYGDLPLSYQRPLTEALECWRIGIRLTDSCTMLPEKSITALCAIRKAGGCPMPMEHACDRCSMVHCPYREESE